MKFRSYLYILFSVILSACASNPYKDLHSGDLLFVSAKTKNLSGAISRVTSAGSSVSYDHVGILSKSGRNYYVYHAAPKGCSQKQNLADFIAGAEKDSTSIAVYRLKPTYRKSIPAAILKAENMLGKPYNFSYILNKSEYYCSDFVERAFRDDKIFKLEPMSFKNPATGETDNYWKEFYAKRGIPVPEGQLGCNPNGLSKSNKIEFVKILNK